MKTSEHPLLLEEEVDEELQEDEERDDHVVSLLQERAGLWPRRRPTAQCTDALVDVLLCALDGVYGTLQFTQVRALLTHSVVVFAFVSFTSGRVVLVGLRR